jgi:hypothetical protein
LSILPVRPKPGRCIDPLPDVGRHGFKDAQRNCRGFDFAGEGSIQDELAISGRLTPAPADPRPREGNPLLVAPRNKARGRAHRLDGAGIAAGEQIITLQPLGHIRGPVCIVGLAICRHDANRVVWCPARSR